MCAEIGPRAGVYTCVRHVGVDTHRPSFPRVARDIETTWADDGRNLEHNGRLCGPETEPHIWRTQKRDVDPFGAELSQLLQV